MPSSRGSSQPRMETVSLTSPALAGGFFTTSTTWEAHYVYRYVCVCVCVCIHSVQFFVLRPTLCFTFQYV